jgi:hypothetical protein
VKGTAITSSLRFLEERFGEAGVSRVREGLAPDERAKLEGGVLNSAWYPIELLLHVMQLGLS